ncbi:MAG: flagella basal body P-ring formation protein FlgA [Myxococcales bacterium]|nr:flagella basal body P-ring formation protein FlgA [Myxococcales bacterium]
MRSRLFIIWLVVSIASMARADDRITVAEILPLLEGTPLGEVAVADAPLPGSSRIVRRAEIRVAIEEAGHDPSSLRIPRSTRVHREARRIEREELHRLLAPALERAAAPCQIERLRLPRSITVGGGALSSRVELGRPGSSGRVTGAITLEVRGREHRFPLSGTLSCPPPVIANGARVQIVAIVGPVRASAPGEARQPGHVGDEIRVRNLLTRSMLLARVIDDHTVEVIR